MKTIFALVFLATTITGVFSSEGGATYNPFSISTWFSYPYQVFQTWFPLFQPQYYPSYLQQRPQSIRPTVDGNVTGNYKEDFRPQTRNIFGVSDTSCESVECLPTQKDIEW